MTKRIALVVLLFVACRRNPETFAQACEQLCAADTDKAVECHVATENMRDSRRIDCVSFCCFANKCENPVANGAGISKCVDATYAQTCLLYTSDKVPAECSKVLY